MDYEERKAKRSQYFSDLQARRKNKVMPFTNPEVARAAQRKSAEARRANAKKTGGEKDAEGVKKDAEGKEALKG